jgi:hypothetical protein
VIDELDGNTEASTQVRRPVERLVHGMAVEQHEHVRALIPRNENASSSDFRIVEIVGRKASQREKRNGFIHRTKAISANVLGGHRARGGGCMGARLRRFRRGRHHLFAEKRGQVLIIFVGASIGRGDGETSDRHRDDAPKASGLFAIEAHHSNTRAIRSSCAGNDTCCFWACAQ